MPPTDPIPELDLSGLRCLDAPPPRAVLDVLVDGLESVGEVEAGVFIDCGDDDAASTRSIFEFGPPHARQRLSARSARDAWRLAVERGLAPPSWLDDPRRCFPDQELHFFCDACRGLGAVGWNYDDLCRDCDGRGSEMTRGRVPLPTTLADVQWMLTSPGLVERAEALAREAVARLGDRGPSTERVQWGRLRLGKPHGGIPVVIFSAIWGATSRPADWDWNAMKGPAFHDAPWWRQACTLHELTGQILCFDVGLARCHRAARVAASPLEPVLKLWELGVMVEELTADAIVLERATHRYIRSWRSGVPYG